MRAKKPLPPNCREVGNNELSATLAELAAAGNRVSTIDVVRRREGYRIFFFKPLESRKQSELFPV